MRSLSAQNIFAKLYDLYVCDWPGELDFYRALLAEPLIRAHGLLELACGTGRVALRLAQEGVRITGLDISPELLQIARAKSSGMSNVSWICGDMQAFELGEQFGGVIIPGHSFQFMITPEQQLECLGAIRRHLVPGGLLVIHLDNPNYGWLAGLLERKEINYRRGDPLTDPVSGQRYRKANYWTFDPAAQTATNHIQWELIDENGATIQTWPMAPMRLHVPFRFEMEHLLRRVDFAVEAVHGDFNKGELTGQSEDMIWLARKPVV